MMDDTRELAIEELEVERLLKEYWLCGDDAMSSSNADDNRADGRSKPFRRAKERRADNREKAIVKVKPDTALGKFGRMGTHLKRRKNSIAKRLLKKRSNRANRKKAGNDLEE